MLKAFAATTTTSEITEGTVSQLEGLVELVIYQIPLMIAGGVVIFLSYLVAKIARSIVENKMSEKGIDEEHKELQILGGRMTYSGVLVLGGTIGLKIAGIDLTAIIAAVAFGIGFALKDLIMNFLAGVMILIGGQITLGDFINVGGTIGKVVEIQSRVTILKALDGTKVIVPNAELFKKQVTSYTSNPFRRIEVQVGVEYRSNLENVVKVCMKTIKTTKGILLEPKPAVLVSEFGDSSINLKIRAWVNSKGGWVKVKSEFMKNLNKNFKDYGITIPWPIRTLVEDKNQEYNEKIYEESAVEDKEVTPNTTPVVTSTVQLEPQVVPVTIDEVEQPLKPLGEKNI